MKKSLLIIVFLIICNFGYLDVVEGLDINSSEINIEIEVKVPLFDRALLMEMQYLLKQLGYGQLMVDGYMSQDTRQAILNYQKANALELTSKINVLMFRQFFDYMTGIKSANNENNMLTIVNPRIDYSYEVLQRDLIGLKKKYPFMEIGSIGKSQQGREIYYIKLGEGPAKIHYNGSHHAREWMTSTLVMKFAEEYADAFNKDKEIEGYNVEALWQGATLYIVPMVNPDGVNLTINGLLSSEDYIKKVFVMNQRSWYLKDWKANINGVDLNRNYDAGWQKAKAVSKSGGYDWANKQFYPGEQPESEPEVQAMTKFTKEKAFEIVIAYHTQGEIIYADYDDYMPENGEKVAHRFSELTGYPIMNSNDSNGFGGYKDWVIDTLDTVGMTVEIGRGTYPLNTNQFEKVYENNKKSMLEGVFLGIKIYENKK